MPSEILEYGIPVVIFVAVASGFFSLIYRMLESRPTPQRPNSSSDFSPDDYDTKNDYLLGELTPALAAQIPVSQSTRTDIEKELRAAGYYGRKAFLEYAAVRTVLVLIPLIATGILALGVEQEQMTTVVVTGLIAAGLGYSLPRIYLFYRGRDRTRKLENALPVAVDMLTLCVSAGQTLPASLGRVAKELQCSHPLLAAEMAITRRHAEISNLPHALRQLSDRVPVGDMRNLALILAQAERLGSETGPALLEFSENLRAGLKQRADSRANQAMFWMLFPTILCLWIPAAILLVGPAILEFRSERAKIFQQWRQSREEMKKLKQESTSAAPGVSGTDSSQ